MSVKNLGRTETDVINAALASLGEQSILESGDNRLSAKQCKNVLPVVQASLYRMFTWDCLLKRAEVNSSGKTKWGDKYTLPLPSDCERIVDVRNADGRKVVYKREGNSLVSSSPYLELLYIHNPGGDYTLLTSSLFEALALRLALRVAPTIKLNQKVVANIQEEYKVALSDAGFADSTEGTPDAPTGETLWEDYMHGSTVQMDASPLIPFECFDKEGM